MKKLSIFIITSVWVIVTVGTASAGRNHTAGGLLVGAGGGAVVGHAISGGVEGVIVGSVVGGTLGLLIGGELDRNHAVVVHRPVMLPRISVYTAYRDRQPKRWRRKALRREHRRHERFERRHHGDHRR